METLIEKIKEEENRLKKLLSTHSCPTVAQSHILGEIDGLQKALELIYEEQYFGKTANEKNDEAVSSENKPRKHPVPPCCLLDVSDKHVIMPLDANDKRKFFFYTPSNWWRNLEEYTGDIEKKYIEGDVDSNTDEMTKDEEV